MEKWTALPPGTLAFVLYPFDVASSMTHYLTTFGGEKCLDPPSTLSSHPRPSIDSRESFKESTLGGFNKRFSLTQYGRFSLASLSHGHVIDSTTSTTDIQAILSQFPFNQLVNLQVGEYVHVLESCGSWYRGYVCFSEKQGHIETRSIRLGIFPMTHVCQIPKLPIKQPIIPSAPDSSSPSKKRTCKLFRRPTLVMKKKKMTDLIHITKWVDSTLEQPKQVDVYKQTECKDVNMASDPHPSLPVPAIPPHSTSLGSKEPLIDEISAALREWGMLLKHYLKHQNYKLFQTVKENFDALYKGRRQLMSKTLSQQELQQLRKDLISKMESINKLQGLDLIVRHPEQGYLVTQHNACILNLARTHYKRAAALKGSSITDAFSKRSLLSSHRSSMHRRYSKLSHEPSAQEEAANKPPPTPVHIGLECISIHAQCCLAGEYAEVHFSLYNEKESKYISERLTVHVDHLGRPFKVDGLEVAGNQPIRTVFRDVEHIDDISLICHIVRVGRMSMSEKDYKSGKSAVYPNLPSAESSMSLASLCSNQTVITLAASLPSNIPQRGHVRRPFGCARLNFEETGILKSRDKVEKEEHQQQESRRSSIQMSRFSASIDNQVEKRSDQGDYAIKIYFPTTETHFSMLNDHMAAFNTNAYEPSQKGEHILVNIQCCPVSNSTLVSKEFALFKDIPPTPKMDPSGMMLPGVYQNSLYLTLLHGEFSQGRKTSAKNVQVSIQVRYNSGSIIEHCITAGKNQKVTRYDSLVYYHSNNPKWNEVIRLDLEPQAFETAHVFLTYRHVSSHTVKDRLRGIEKEEKYFAFSFLPLLRGDKTVLGDGSHTLTLYKYDKKWAVPSVYLNYAAGPQLFGYVGNDHSQPTSAEFMAYVADSMAKVPAMGKDTTTLKTHLYSSVLTQNVSLHKVLRWTSYDDLIRSLPDAATPSSSKNIAVISSVLKEFPHMGEVEVVKFLPSLFQSLCIVLNSPCNAAHMTHSSETMGALDCELLSCIIYLLSVVHDRRFSSHRQILDDFIEHQLPSLAPTAWLHLTVAFQKLVVDGMQEKDLGRRAKELKSGLKVWKDIMKCCIKSWLHYRERVIHPVQAEDVHFPSLLSRLFSSVNVLMSLVSPSHVLTTQSLALKSFPSLVNILKSIMSAEELIALVENFFASCQSGVVKLNGHRLTCISGLVKNSFSHHHCAEEFDAVEYRSELFSSAVGWLLEWLKGSESWCEQTDQDKPYSVIHSNEKDNFQSWTTAIADMIDRTHRLLEEEGWIDESLCDSHSSTGDLKHPSLALIHRMVSLLPKLIGLYVELLEHKKTLYPNSKSHRKDAYFPFAIELSDIASVTLALFHLMPSYSIIQFLQEKQRLKETSLQTWFFTFQSWLTDDAFPLSWPVMHIITHRVILKILGPVGEMLVKEADSLASNQVASANVLQSFQADLSAYFQTLLKLLNSNWVQVERFDHQHSRVAREAGADIREAGGKLLQHVWIALSRHSSYKNGTQESWTSIFSPQLMGYFIELTLSPHTSLKNTAIHLLFGALECEYEKNGNLQFAQAECIDKLERLVMGEGKGNDQYPTWLIEKLLSKFPSKVGESEEETSFVVAGKTFVFDVDKFLQLCLIVRNLDSHSEISDDKAVENYNYAGKQITSMLKLMRFVRNIGHRGIYVKYAHKLANIHLEQNRHVEAALALKLHADVLTWSKDLIVEPLPEYNFPKSQNAFDRKAAILQHVVDLLERGQAWERAYEVLKDLAVRYEKGPNLNFSRLAEIHARQSQLLQKVGSSDDSRFPPTYYRVHFHGQGWSDELRGNEFVYKAGEWERLATFIEKIMNEYPDAQLLRNNGPVGPEISHHQAKYLQITSLKPEIDIRKWFNQEGFQLWPLKWENSGNDVKRFQSSWVRSDSITDCSETSIPLVALEPDLDNQPDGIGIKTLHLLQTIPEAIRKYLLSNEVQLFSYCRPVKRKIEDSHLKGAAKEFLELWTEKTLLVASESFPCLSDRSLVLESITFEISPIENAIISVRGKNRQLLELEKTYGATGGVKLNINPFTMALNGAVDAPVNGGIPMYKQAFLQGNKTHHVSALEDAIKQQMDIIERCLALHDKIVPEEMRPLHENIVVMFKTLKQNL